MGDDYKKRIKNLIDTLGEYNADYNQILEQLEEIRLSCMEGIEQEKVSVKDGVLLVVEKYPHVAQAAVIAKLAVLKELARVAEQEEINPDIDVTINIDSLENDPNTLQATQGTAGDIQQP